MIFFAPIFLNITHIEAAIMGAVIGAVSPAVIVPKMLKLSDEGYGKENGIPQLIMTGASVDDIFVIVMFSAFVCLEQTGNVSVMSFAKNSGFHYFGYHCMRLNRGYFKQIIQTSTYKRYCENHSYIEYVTFAQRI